jgi:cytochrome c biogenesis protein CcmG/thiol:disulfide interchange protein DsbE
MSRILPLAAFLALCALLVYGLFNADGKSELPSPLIGKPVPAFALPTLFEPDRVVSREDLAGEPYVVNFWGSWCPTCVEEHPMVARLAESGRVRVVGFNFRDEPADAKAWLARLGDPYDLHLVDRDGRISIDFGVYAAPETFLVDASGVIVFKHLGALTEEVIQQEIYPRLEASAGAGP